MKKNDDAIKNTDELLHDAIMEEGERLEKVLGPITYEHPEDEDIDASFQKLLKERQEMKENNKAYHDQIGSKDSLDKEKEPVKVQTVKSVRKRFSTLTKAAIIVLVAGVCVVGVSMQSDATRMWWMESFGWKIGDDSATKVNNDESRELADAPEWEAAATIEKKLGIKVPRLVYMPAKLEFSDYMYEEVTNSAIMYYKIGDEYLTLNMIVSTHDFTSSANFDGTVVSVETWDTAFATVTVREIETGDKQVTTMSAEWDYQDAHYEFFGRISKEEMKKIIENIVL